MNVRLVTGSWQQLAQDAGPLRYQVFVLEQLVPPELEWDDMDQPSLHVVAYDDDARAVGTARLLPDGHIGRMAVRQGVRGAGIGSALLHTLLHEAKQRGDPAVCLNAQIQAEGFYRRHGFVREGPEFIDAGIPHIFMRRVFPDD